MLGIFIKESSSYDELLLKDGLVSIHHRNIQNVAIEMFKVEYYICHLKLLLIHFSNKQKLRITYGIIMTLELFLYNLCITGPKVVHLN